MCLCLFRKWLRRGGGGVYHFLGSIARTLDDCLYTDMFPSLKIAFKRLASAC